MRKWFTTGGNLREQHDPKRAIGKALTLEERADGVYISGRVVDPVTVSKVSEGVLQYISIGVKGYQLVTRRRRSLPTASSTGAGSWSVRLSTVGRIPAPSSYSPKRQARTITWQWPASS